jgi:hypothetical protein
LVAERSPFHNDCERAGPVEYDGFSIRISALPSRFFSTGGYFLSPSSVLSLELTSFCGAELNPIRIFFDTASTRRPLSGVVVEGFCR